VLLVSGGVHGNEPSGIIALQRIFEKLESKNIPIKGGILGMSGKLAALKKWSAYDC
jgi:succinylglutamate desuccinylase